MGGGAYLPIRFSRFIDRPVKTREFVNFRVLEALRTMVYL